MQGDRQAMAELTRAIGRLEATADGLNRRLDQNHKDMKELIGAFMAKQETHEERLDGFDRDRTRLYTIAGAIGLMASFLGADRLLQWLGKP